MSKQPLNDPRDHIEYIQASVTCPEVLLAQSFRPCLLFSVPVSRMSPEPHVHIGVLALQGSFREHIACFNKLDGVSASEVRNKRQLEEVQGLVIPGGTALAR